MTNGEVIKKYDYTPFGQLAKTDENVENVFKFSSEYAEKETGLIYYNYRYYNPTTGKWIKRDPIGEDGGAGLYVMIDNDCVNYIDNLGLSNKKRKQKKRDRNKRQNEKKRKEGNRNKNKRKKPKGKRKPKRKGSKTNISATGLAEAAINYKKCLDDAEKDFDWRLGRCSCPWTEPKDQGQCIDDAVDLFVIEAKICAVQYAIDSAKSIVPEEAGDAGDTIGEIIKNYPKKEQGPPVFQPAPPFLAPINENKYPDFA
ncbi:RHS repeat-associated core domain-containing protein [Lentisphaerota bacterium WC36G]|nr:RHS repeat-associated core domain-containing protein [Lentisphaerae bacterium WC36]